MKLFNLKYLPFLFVFTSIILKLFYITTFPIQLDEPFSIFTSNLNWKEFFQVFVNENNPPLHPLLLKMVISFLGLDFFWMRFLSVLFSSFSIWFLYKGLEHLYSNKEAILASTFMLLSNLQMVYSHQIRAYALLVMLACMCFYSFVLVLKSNKKRNLFLLGVSFALMMFTHFMGILSVFFMSLSVFIYWKEKEIRNRLFYSLVVAFIIFCPYLPIFISRFLASTGGTWIEKPTSFMSVYYSIWRFFNAPLVTIIAILIFFSAFYFLRKRKENHFFLYFLNIQIILSLVGIYFFSFIIPLYIDRYLIFVSPFIYAYIAIIIVYWSDVIKNNYFKKLTLLLVPVLFLATFKIDADINMDSNVKWEFIKSQTKNHNLIISPSWDDLNYCYYLDSEYFFVNSRAEFDSLRFKSKIYTELDFIKNPQLFSENEFYVYSKNQTFDKNIELIFKENFSLHKKINDYLFVYKKRK